ncbi:MAG: hypothetical protein H0U74_19645 [Bradymonadaceae bacterium]|nr:hypothetical protein [Lujinxingiaceae bacterium]
MKCALRGVVLLGLLFLLAACEDENNKVVKDQPDASQTADTTDATPDEPLPQRDPGPAHEGIYSFVNGCYRMDAAAPTSISAAYLVSAEGGSAFAFTGSDEATASRFFMKASDLGTYLFYDEDEQFFVVEDETFLRKAELLSDIFTLDDSYLPGAQWELEVSGRDATRFQMRHLRSGRYLTTTGLAESVAEAAVITLYRAEGCTAFPELTLDAEGEVVARQFEDGSLFGYVETHSHIMSNFGFGGAGIFHGAAFHPLGVKHALPSCEMFHGAEGRADLFGFGFDRGADIDEETMFTSFVTGRTPEFSHHTDGYPSFTDWPNAPTSSTHQTQYYLWIKRAYLSGLRLMVNHATSNQIICELVSGTKAQPIRYSCNDMVAADRSIEETRRLERYIDAQEGGPGKGWFRIVESPEQAREVISEGKLAIVLGLEVSNLFDCFLVPVGGGERCTEREVIEALDRYHAKGVRAIFPVHKFDNAFSAGDGSRDIIELGNFAQTGHWSNFTDDCPDQPTNFDRGSVTFGGLNEMRDDYLAKPPNDMSNFAGNPNRTLLTHAERLRAGPLHGNYCQKAGITRLGEFLIEELMKRGMIIEIDHLPRRAYRRAFEMLVEKDYPAVGTHGVHNDGALYGLGGVSKFSFGVCSDPGVPGGRANSLRDRLELINAAGAFPAEGLGLDLNGFAGAPGPRFGDKSPCTDQINPVTYPFQSFAGDITFTKPRIGERELEFNTEGLTHIGMLPEFIADVRSDGVSDLELEALFKSAEGYLRMWEKAERRGAQILGQ